VRINRELSKPSATPANEFGRFGHKIADDMIGEMDCADPANHDREYGELVGSVYI
jgi:hypothetical protein